MRGAVSNVINIRDLVGLKNRMGLKRCTLMKMTFSSLPMANFAAKNVISPSHRSLTRGKPKLTAQPGWICARQDRAQTRHSGVLEGLVCHPLYPHSNNNLVRGFLNMHTGFMFCELCHIKREKFKHLTYDWKNTENEHMQPCCMHEIKIL